MIRINLLPSDKRPRRKKKAGKGALPPVLISLILATLISMGLAGVGFYFYDSKLKEEIELLKNSKKDKEDTIAIFKKVKKIKANHKIIEGLKARQIVPLHIVEEVTGLLPDFVWIAALGFMDYAGSTKESIGLNYSKDGVSMSTPAYDGNGTAVLVVGGSLTNNEIVNYVDAFKQSKVFQTVYLTKSIEQRVPITVFDQSAHKLTTSGSQKLLYFYGVSMEINESELPTKFVETKPIWRRRI
ncbi:secreted protein [Candidatus Magnetobacterium bavaricum]|uniref:Secreted protein n=1 Tax=Candidatus Magnetobacterium bavaricum TaxID=29290 RepID=A0A0F3H070_9BACT|nr:secreted protein [Candidatus Magnetobacterium bavaricum]